MVLGFIFSGVLAVSIVARIYMETKELNGNF